VQAEPTFAKIQRLNQAIPQYNIGHQERLQMIMQNTSQQAGLFLTGNYFSGVSVADTIEHARSTADNVLAHLGVWSP
jgi:oxygen-dependent protoporphyrinogen oxidase